MVAIPSQPPALLRAALISLRRSKSRRDARLVSASIAAARSRSANPATLTASAALTWSNGFRACYHPPQLVDRLAVQFDGLEVDPTAGSLDAVALTGRTQVAVETNHHLDLMVAVVVFDHRQRHHGTKHAGAGRSGGS